MINYNGPTNSQHELDNAEITTAAEELANLYPSILRARSSRVRQQREIAALPWSEKPTGALPHTDEVKDLYRHVEYMRYNHPTWAHIIDQVTGRLEWAGSARQIIGDEPMEGGKRMADRYVAALPFGQRSDAAQLLTDLAATQAYDIEPDSMRIYSRELMEATVTNVVNEIGGESADLTPTGIIAAMIDSRVSGF